MSRMILLTTKMEIQFNNPKFMSPNLPILCTSPQRGHKGDIMGTYMTFTGHEGDLLHTINFSNPADKARHDRMVALVNQMLDLNKKLLEVRLEQERTMLSRQIEATDGAIDKLVYELYGLTEEEIKIVNGNGK